MKPRTIPVLFLLRSIVSVFFAIVLLALSQTTFAAALVNGGSMSGSIDAPGDEDTHSFSISAGESVNIRVADTSDSDFSPWLYVYAPDGSYVTNSYSTTVASVTLNNLSVGGTYTVVVLDASSGRAQTGSYDIHFAKATGANEGGALINGGIVSDTIDLGDIDSYTFDVEAGESVNIRVADTSDSNFNPWLYIYAPDGNYVTNSYSTTVASVTLNNLSVGGTYTVVVLDASSGRAQTGSYDIHFAKATGANEGGALINGGKLSDTIDLGDIDSYTFDAEVGESVNMRLADTSDGAFNPWLYVYAPDGSYITNSYSTTVASVTLNNLSVGGTYTVVVLDASSGRAQTGSYDIHFAKATGANEGGALINGGKLSDTIDLGDIDSYTFALSSGQDAQIQVMDSSGGDFVPWLYVYGPDGRYITNSYGATLAEVGLRNVVVGGTYTAMVFDASGSRAQTGSYDIYLNRDSDVVDNDNDGIPNDIDNCPNIVNPGQEDFNNDGEGDHCGDFDGDNVVDINDQCPLVSAIGDDDNNDGCIDPDVDSDGVSDYADNCPLIPNADQADFNSDGDGDVCSDFDNDGVVDANDSCPGQASIGDDINGDGCTDTPEDLDGDGVSDNVDNCPAVANPDQADFDNDNQGDACSDADGDGVFDADDSCPLEAATTDADGDGCTDIGVLDTDGDGVLNDTDNCPQVANPGQADFNDDGEGDACGDIDADGVLDADDSCPLEAATTDADGDGCMDIGVTDTDGDGILNDTDNCPQIANPDQDDFNNDGVGDACSDVDGDGVGDSEDSCPLEAAGTDIDGDGCADEEGEMCSHPLTGDFDGDCDINLRDLKLLLQQYGQAAEPGSQFDLNSDGTISGKDVCKLILIWVRSNQAKHRELI